MIGIIGYGNIGKAIVKGLNQSDTDMANKIFVSNDNDKFYETNKENKLFVATRNNNELIKKCKIIFLCVKPEVFKAVSEGIKEDLSKDTILISLAPDIKISELREMYKNHEKIIRLMPNTPMEVLQGTMIMSKDDGTSDEDDIKLINSIIEKLGKVYWVDESLLKATIGIAGSASAFVYMLLESLGNGGISNGLSKEIAYEMAAQTIKGAGEMYLQTKEHPAILKDQVCSPGGITIKAVQVLEELGFRNAIIKAVKETNK